MAKILEKIEKKFNIFKVNILEPSADQKYKETSIITEVSAESLSKVFHNGDLVKIIFGEN